MQLWRARPDAGSVQYRMLSVPERGAFRPADHRAPHAAVPQCLMMPGSNRLAHRGYTMPDNNPPERILREIR
jgi:hypothetical protein